MTTDNEHPRLGRSHPDASRAYLISLFGMCWCGSERDSEMRQVAADPAPTFEFGMICVAHPEHKQS